MGRVVAKRSHDDAGNCRGSWLFAGFCLLYAAELRGLAQRRDCNSNTDTLQSTALRDGLQRGSSPRVALGQAKNREE